jgi:hypothetical protein
MCLGSLRGIPLLPVTSRMLALILIYPPIVFWPIMCMASLTVHWNSSPPEVSTIGRFSLSPHEQGIMYTSVACLPKGELPGQPKDSFTSTILVFFSPPDWGTLYRSLLLDSPHPSILGWDFCKGEDYNIPDVKQFICTLIIVVNLRSKSNSQNFLEFESNSKSRTVFEF